MNQAAIDLLWYWIREREAIRIKKERGEPRPWTSDPHLGKHHFCNVRREDDRTTKEIRDLGLAEDTNHLPWFYTLARLFNYAPSVKVIQMLGINEGSRTLRLAKQGGAKVFHTAYVVSTCGQEMDKIDYVVSLAEDVRRIMVPTGSLARAHDRLMDIKGLGSFMAGQIVADLKNDRYLRDATDWHSWSAIGPGSRKGLQYIWPDFKDAQYRDKILALYNLMPPDVANMRLHAQDLQNCLCEFSKFYRYHQGDMGGRVRNYHEGS